MNWDDIEKIIRSRIHEAAMAGQSNWQKLDELIADLRTAVGRHIEFRTEQQDRLTRHRIAQEILKP